MSRRGAFALTVLTGAALAGGCAAETKPPIPLGEPRPTTPITLANPDASGLLPLSEWPAACDLLSDVTIREVLPTATTVEIKRVPPTADIAGKDHVLPSGKAGQDHVLPSDVAGQEHVLPDDAECRIGVDFAEAKPGESGELTGQIHLTVWVAGTPELARKNYDENVAATRHDERTTCPAELVTTAGLDDCTDDGDAWTFLEHGVAGEMRGSAPSLRDGFHFVGRKKKNSDRRIWHNTVQARLLQAVAGRLP